MVSGTKQMLNKHSQDKQLDENGAEAGLMSRGVWLLVRVYGHLWDGVGAGWSGPSSLTAPRAITAQGSP